MTLAEFHRHFATDEACRERLFHLRWGEGFRCQSAKGYVRRDRPLMECAGCGYQASVMAGTVFHRSHVPLRKWFLAIFLNAQTKRGISAFELSKQIGVHRETAWTMVHKLRQAMAARDQLYTLGGVDHGKVGRGTLKRDFIAARWLRDPGNPIPRQRCYRSHLGSQVPGWEGQGALYGGDPGPRATARETDARQNGARWLYPLLRQTRSTRPVAEDRPSLVPTPCRR